MAEHPGLSTVRGNRQRSAERIVVGVDGSTGSFVALRWAINEARACNLAVHAVLVSQLNLGFGDPGLASLFPVGIAGGRGPRLPLAKASPIPGAGAYDQESKVGPTDRTDPIQGGLDTFSDHDNSLGRHIHVTQEIVEGHAAKVLLESVSTSDLLVVGAHGNGGLGGAMLGSVSRHVASHARCAVVIVADPEREPR